MLLTLSAEVAELQRVLRGREGRRRAYKQGNFVETELQEAATLMEEW